MSKLFFCQPCSGASIDSLALDNQICETYSAVYNQVSPVASDEEILAACNLANNGPNCASRACSVETKFVREIAHWQLSNLADTAYLHKNGFNSVVECATTPGVFSERQCCGAYPNRFPYRTLSGERQCCGSKLYLKSDLLNCCADGSLKISC